MYEKLASEIAGSNLRLDCFCSTVVSKSKLVINRLLYKTIQGPSLTDIESEIVWFDGTNAGLAEAAAAEATRPCCLISEIARFAGYPELQVSRVPEIAGPAAVRTYH